jgi:hypothetical protein
MSERRDFELPPNDAAFLDAVHSGWQAVRDGAASWIRLQNFVVPAGYNVNSVTAVLRIEPTYPDTQIDMVFFNPFLARADGLLIGATGGQVQVEGVVFQQWSRHRSGENPWRAGIDDIESHLLLVKHWLEREFLK